MIEKEETILRKFLSNDQVIVLMQNDILHLVAMAMRAYKNEDTLVKKLTLTDVVKPFTAEQVLTVLNSSYELIDAKSFFEDYK